MSKTIIKNQDQKLGLNPFAVIVRNEEEYYAASDALNLSPEKSFTLNEEQKAIFQELKKGKNFSIKELQALFGEDLFKFFLENNLLLPFTINTEAALSRTDAYYRQVESSQALAYLAKKSILILGCGGIGSHVAWNLVNCGIGKIILLDGDVVERSNLNRQILYRLSDIGQSKAESLRQHLLEIQPEQNIEIVDRYIKSQADLEEVVTTYNPDFIIKTLDTPEEMPYWIDRVCKELRISYLSGTFTSTLSLCGPLYDAKNDTDIYSDFFPNSYQYKHESGLTPSISFVAAHAASTMTASTIRYLLKGSDERFEDQIQAYDIFNGKQSIMHLKDNKYEIDEERKINFTYAFTALFIAVASIMMSVSDDVILPWWLNLAIPLIALFLFRTRAAAVRASFIMSLWYVIFLILSFLIINRAFVVNLQFFQIVGLIFGIFIGLSFILIVIQFLTFILGSLRNKVFSFIRRKVSQKI